MHFLRPFKTTQTYFNEVAVDVSFLPPPPTANLFFFLCKILIDRIIRILPKNTYHKKVIVTGSPSFPHSNAHNKKNIYYILYIINLQCNHLRLFI